MRRILLAFYLFICTTANAQKFTKDYLISEMGSLQRSVRSVSMQSDTIYLSDKQKQELMCRLNSKLNTTLINLDDPKRIAFYDKLWGSGFTAQLEANIKNLQKSLNDPTYRPSLNNVPDPAMVSAMLTMQLDAVTKGKSRPGEQQINLEIRDPYKVFLLKYYEQSKNHWVGDHDMNIEYIRKWRVLENNYKNAVKNYEILKELAGKVMDCDESDNPLVKQLNAVIKFESGFEEADKLAIHTFLTKNNFLKDWLWYTGGKLAVNPLIVTNTWLLYPNSEPNSLITPADTTLFSSVTMDAELKKFLVTSRVVNKVTFPVTEKDGEFRLYQYDGANGYKTDVKANKKAISDEQAIAVLVHNVPNSTSISISLEEGDLKDRGFVAGELDDALNIFSGAITDVGGKSDAISAILGLFNPAQLTARAPIVKVSGGKKMQASEAYATFSQSGKMMQGYDTIQNSLARRILEIQRDENTEEVDAVEIETYKIPLIKDQNVDKRTLIIASLTLPYNTNCKGQCKSIPPVLIDSFIARDECVRLKYEKELINEGANKLFERFNCFMDKVERCNKVMLALTGNLEEKMNSYLPYLEITNRSIPPQLLTSETDDNELYRTIVYYPDVPAAPKKLIYTLKEERKEGEEEVKTDVVKQSIKVGGIHYIDVSAGVAFTTSAYTVGKRGANDLPERDPGEQFKVIAGLNFYPFGLFKQDNRIPGTFKNRISAFVGISIPKSLDNYYTGVSYDWVPGIRTIAGAHFFKETRFKVFNNQITDQASGLKTAGLFLSVNIEPSTFVKALGLF